MIATPLETGTMKDWRTLNAEWLVCALEQLRLRLHRHALWLRSDWSQAAGHAVITDAEAAHWLAPRSESAQQRFLLEDPAAIALTEQLAAAERELYDRSAIMAEAGYAPALELLARRAELSPFERDIVLFCLASELDGSFARICGYLQDDAYRDYPTLELALALFVPTPVDRLLARDCLLPARPLRRLRLIQVEAQAAEPLLRAPLRIDERMVDYLRGVDRRDARIADLLRSVSPALLASEESPTREQIARGLETIGAVWPVLNVIGEGEHGARDFAQAACSQLGYSLIAIDLAGFAASALSRRELTALLERESTLSGFVYLVDTEPLYAGNDPALRAIAEWLIDMLNAPMVVISRERWQSDAVTAVVPVARPSRAHQRELWLNALGEQAQSLNGELDRITQQFDFGPPSIARVARTINFRQPATRAELADALWSACRGIGGRQLDDLANRLAPRYSWNDIVLPANVVAQLRDLAAQVQQRTQVYEAWGFGDQLGKGRGISALFAGVSGTGKTMAAEILAHHLSLDLYRIDLAGIVSKYIGETEKNLRRVFDAAERTGAILFFDEADALFGTRTEVRDSHDRYANIEVNYLLQRMEEYAGLAILATNRKAALDSAFLRRLRFLIDFPFPSRDDRRRIWQLVFPPRAETAGLDHGFLSGLELAGGNIRSIAINAAFLAAADGRPIEMQHVMRATAREFAKIERPVTTAEFGTFYDLVRT